MGFLDKAKAAASDLAAKADTAMAGSGLGGPGGSPERFFRDLGVIAYLAATDRPTPPDDRERLVQALKEAEAAGAIRTFALQTAPPPPGTTPPPPGTTPPPPAPGAPPPASGPAAPPPPPPSWMNKDEG